MKEAFAQRSVANEQQNTVDSPVRLLQCVQNQLAIKVDVRFPMVVVSEQAVLIPEVSCVEIESCGRSSHQEPRNRQGRESNRQATNSSGS